MKPNCYSFLFFVLIAVSIATDLRSIKGAFRKRVKGLKSKQASSKPDVQSSVSNQVCGKGPYSTSSIKARRQDPSYNQVIKVDESSNDSTDESMLSSGEIY